MSRPTTLYGDLVAAWVWDHLLLAQRRYGPDARLSDPAVRPSLGDAVLALGKGATTIKRALKRDLGMTWEQLLAEAIRWQDITDPPRGRDYYVTSGYRLDGP
ncbi:MAG: hypothetical protein ABI725_04525 [Chloroflexota bacterium]